MISSNKNIKVFIFTAVHPWNDIRIFYKQTTSLGKKYSVELHAPARFTKKIINNITVYGLPLWTNKKDRIKTYFILLKRIWMSNADIYHFHDPELILHGLCLKLLRRKKVIYDVHENLIQLIKERSWIPFIYKKPLTILYLILEKLSVRVFDKIVLAEESYKQFIPNNSVIILNFPLFKQYISKEEKTIDAIYVGGVLEERGAFELVKIAKCVTDKIPNFTMKIIGPVGQSIGNKLTQCIKDINLLNNVVLTGRLDYYIAMKEIQKSKIGLAILHPKGNYVRSLPTKLFEYMSYELPYIASDFRYWRSFFRGDKAGYFVQYDNVQYSAEKILTLLVDDRLRNQLGKRGRELVEKNFNWVSEEKKLFILYKELVC